MCHSAILSKIAPLHATGACTADALKVGPGLGCSLNCGDPDGFVAG